MVDSLRLHQLCRSFGSVRAVNELSLDIPAGTLVTLLGPSGCGKSTTLNMIAGLDRPDAGTIHLGETDITKVPPNMRRMAMVFQNYALYPHMSVFDNVAFSLKLQHRPRAEIQSRVAAVAEMLDMGHLLDRKPGQLSGGQQQRVALGRALAKEPDVFLFDEPFSNLDAGLRARMRTEVKRLHARLGTTSVFVTHDQEEAMALSDFIAVLRDGRLVQYGTQHEIYGRPRNTYVGTFVGKPRMSLVRGTLEYHDGWVEFGSGGFKVNLGSPGDLGLRNEYRPSVAIGIRAEDIRIGPPGRSASSRSFTAIIGLVEPVGSDTYLELMVGDETLVARAAPELHFTSGQPVQTEFVPGRVHVFDADTGERIN